MKPSIPSMLPLALLLGSLAPSAHALNFVYHDVGAAPMTATQLAAFQAAGDLWAGLLFDPVTVTLNIEMAPLGPGVLGGADATMGIVSYSSLRGRLAADALSAADASAVTHLQPAPALSFLRTIDASLSSTLDNNGGTNNTVMALTSANAKALGYATGNLVDGKITFSSTFNFDYDRNTPGPVGAYDFVSVAMHEIGHVLGFVSGVDDVDAGLGTGFWLDKPGRNVETDVLYSALDLYRYSAPGVLDFRVGGSPFLSIDGGLSSSGSFSTGAFLGNGNQASHFANGSANLMRPAFGPNQVVGVSASDLLAFDVMGWNLTASIPEPETYALLLAGLGVVGLRARRRA